MKLTAGEWFILRDFHRLRAELEHSELWTWKRDPNPLAGGWLAHPGVPPIYLPETSSVFDMVEANHTPRT